MKNKIIKSDERYLSDLGWLKSFHIFSFANYFDPENVSFWNLRVFNDDYISWKSWFWLHPHSNMEILTIILDWELTHGDNIWNKKTIKKWQIQTMTAWTGIFHSEENNSDKEVHLYQIWFTPDHRWNPPSYTDLDIDLENNKLNLIASNSKIENIWYVDSDIKVYYAICEKWNTLKHKIEENRWLFLYVYKWKLSISWKNIWEWDQLRYEIEWNYDIEVDSDAEFILIDVKL